MLPFSAREHRIRTGRAEGIFLPEIRSIDDINAAAEAAFFPPKGDRGICPSVRAANFNFRSFNRYADWNNREINLIPMIENPESVELIDQICSHPDVHVVIFDQGDLALSLGEGTQMGAGRKAAEAYRKILDSAKKHNVAVMGGPVLTPNAKDCREALEDGGGKRIFRLDFTRIDSRYQYLFFISQAETERIPRTAVEKQGVRVRTRRRARWAGAGRVLR